MCPAGHQLGVQDNKERVCPIKLTHLPRCTAIAAASISMAISQAGRLYVWGYDRCLNPAPNVSELSSIYREQAEAFPAEAAVGGDEVPSTRTASLQGDSATGSKEFRALVPAYVVGAPPAEGAPPLPEDDLVQVPSLAEMITVPLPPDPTSAAADTDRQPHVGAELAIQDSGVSFEASTMAPSGAKDSVGVDSSGAQSPQSELPPGPAADQPTEGTQPEGEQAEGAAQPGHSRTAHADDGPRESWAAAPRAVTKNKKGPSLPPKPPAPSPLAHPLPPALIPVEAVQQGQSVFAQGGEGHQGGEHRIPTHQPPPPPPPAPPLPPPPPPPPPLLLPLRPSLHDPAPLSDELSFGPAPASMPPMHPGSSASTISTIWPSAAAAVNQGMSVLNHPVVREVTWIQPQQAVAIACSTQHAVVATEDGCVFMWGSESVVTQQITGSKVRRVQPQPPKPGSLTHGALQLLDQLYGGGVGGARATSEASVTALPAMTSVGSQAGSTLVDARSSYGALPWQADPEAALAKSEAQAELDAAEEGDLPREPALSMMSGSMATAAPACPTLPVGWGGASLWRLNLPGRGTGVWVMTTGEEDPDEPVLGQVVGVAASFRKQSSLRLDHMASSASLGGDGNWEDGVQLHLRVFNGVVHISLKPGKPLVSPRTRVSLPPGASDAVSTSAKHSVVHASPGFSVHNPPASETILASAELHLPELRCLPIRPAQAILKRRTTPTGELRSPQRLSAATPWGRGEVYTPPATAASVPEGTDAVVGDHALVPASRTALHTARENVFALAAGEMHTLCLCASSR